MSQIVPSLAAPPRAPSPWLRARRGGAADAPGRLGSTPFSRTRAGVPVAWLPGFAFGLVCLGAGLVVVVALAVVGVALAVGGLVTRWLRAVTARRPLAAL